MSENNNKIVVDLNDADFADFITAGFVVVDFWAPWCGPCINFGPVFSSVAMHFKSDNVKFGKFNVDSNQRVPSKFGVRLIPTIIIFKDGEEVERANGPKTEAQFKKWVGEILKS